MDETHIQHLPPKDVAALILATEDTSRLEAIGRSLSLEQCLELFASLPNAVRRLSPVIVGLPHSLFRELLQKGDEEQLRALKQQGMSEPLQHQLTIYLHKLSEELEELDARYFQLEAEIETLDPQTSSLQTVWQQLCAMSIQYQELMRETSTLLLLAWNTNRGDLIDQLTLLKERCHGASRVAIGFPETAKEKATGLFKKLDEKIFSIYGDAKNDEPAIEGLAHLSAWYPQDYYELGLIPHLEMDPEILFEQAQVNLTKAGLATVKDLKSAWIYSKETLAEYLLSSR